MSENNQTNQEQDQRKTRKHKHKEAPQHQQTFEMADVEGLKNAPTGFSSGTPSDIMNPGPSAILQRQPSSFAPASREPEPQPGYPHLQLQGRNFAQVPLRAGNRATKQPKPLPTKPILQRKGGKISAHKNPGSQGMEPGGGESPMVGARQVNKIGLPDNLKSGIEGLSGLSMDDVSVHYNSAKPAPLQALAYTQGTDIHVGPGQEKHLSHEAWHVVQQKQGRVKPTLQMKGTAINDDSALEREATVMGRRANAVQTDRYSKSDFRTSHADAQLQMKPLLTPHIQGVVQLKKLEEDVQIEETANGKWALPEANHRLLYGRELGEGLKPSGHFPPFDTAYEDYLQGYKNGDTYDKMKEEFKDQCSAYAFSLHDVDLSPEAIEYTMHKELVGESAPEAGQMYWFEPSDARFKPKQGKLPIPHPDRMSEDLLQGPTPQHFSSVIATDGDDVITSEVNAAFGTSPPWFTMYHGTGTFYKAFEAEYTFKDKKGKEFKPNISKLHFEPKR